MVPRILFLFSFLSLPLAALAQREQAGNWSANSTKGALYHGAWTAVPDSAGATLQGTWTLMNADGGKVAEGRWSAAKAPTGWSGAWRANVVGRSGESIGTWSSSIDLENGGLEAIFEKAIETVVSGAWGMNKESGAWSIRASPHAKPNVGGMVGAFSQCGRFN